MRRYSPLLLISFFLIVLAVSGTALLAGYAERQRPENLIKSITVYTTLPVEQVSLLANEYERSSQVRINIVPMPPNELLARAVAEKNAPKADFLLADASVLREAKKLGLMDVYASEQTDIIPDRFNDKDSYWHGLWYDVFVFAANRDALAQMTDPPLKWTDLTNGKLRIAITDFLAADAAAQLFFALISSQGEEPALQYLYKLHRQIVQYSKFLSTPVRMAGMGEADLAIAVQSEALRYMNDGFPIKILYPEEGTAYLLFGGGIIKSASNLPEAKAFLDWLLKDSAQAVLSRNKYFYISTNPETTTAKIFAQTNNNSKLFEVKETLTPGQRQKVLDRWVQTVRLAPK
jgi:iron(III) transport system substrate-binding protein